MKPLQAGDPETVGGGRYRITARLGSGGMGVVYLGRSPSGRTVAVKVVRPQLAEDRGFRRRFAQEVAAARRVGGFHTAPVVDADPDGDPPWLVTAYVPGPSLHEVVGRCGPLPADTLTVLAAGLAEALEAVHGAGVVHRDLKPANIIVADDGPRVIDFGIARALDHTSLTLTGLQVGTPGFLAPEQLTGGAVSPAVDVFALGIVLCRAAGALPFGDGPSASVLYRTVHEEPDLRAVPEGLRGTVAACLAKDPAARPSPRALLDRLVVPDRDDEGDWLPEDVRALLAEHAARVPGARRPAGTGAGAGAGTPAEASSRPPAEAAPAAAPGAGPGPGPGPGPAAGTGPGAGPAPRPTAGQAAGPTAGQTAGRATDRAADLTAGPAVAATPTAPSLPAPPRPTAADRGTQQPVPGGGARPVPGGADAPPPGGSAPGGAAGTAGGPGAAAGPSQAATAPWSPAPPPPGRTRRRLPLAAAAVAVLAASAVTMALDPFGGGKGKDAGSGPPSPRASASAPAGPPDTQLLIRLDLPGNVLGKHCRSVIGTRRTGRDDPSPLVRDGSCDSLPQWAPDGRSFAFTRTDGDSSAVWTARRDGTGARRIASIAKGSRVSWSPDGTRLAALQVVKGVQQLVVVTVSDGSSRSLTTGTERIEDPAWSPDGRSVAFCRQRSGTWQVYLTDPYTQDGAPRQVTHAPVRALDPAWSPDGRRIAYTSGSTTSGPGKGDIHVVGADGRGDRTVAASADHEMDPSWSADGAWIAYVRGPIPEPRIWAVRADGTGARELTTGASWESHPAWPRR